MPDELTGLHNRNELLAALDSGLRTAPSMACLLVDIDRMKPLNQCLGHIVGDSILQEVGRRIASVAGSDAFVARFGGDEFAAVSSRWTADEVVGLADRVGERILATPVNKIAEPHHLSGDELDQLTRHEFLGLRLFGPIDNGNYAIAALPRLSNPDVPVVAPFEGMPIDAAYLSASIGVSFVTGPGATAAMLLQEADKAMYLEKRRR